MAIRLTEARLRKIIREEARKLVEYLEPHEGEEGPDAEAHRAMAALEAELRGGVFDPNGLAFKVIMYDDNNRNFGSGLHSEKDPRFFLGLLSEAWGESSGEYFGDPGSHDDYMPETKKRAARCHQMLVAWEIKHEAEIEGVLETMYGEM
jgi:hypothetical protein